MREMRLGPRGLDWNKTARKLETYVVDSASGLQQHITDKLVAQHKPLRVRENMRLSSLTIPIGMGDSLAVFHGSELEFHLMNCEEPFDYCTLLETGEALMVWWYGPSEVVVFIGEPPPLVKASRVRNICREILQGLQHVARSLWGTITGMATEGKRR